MFHVRKRLLRFGGASLERSFSVKRLCSFFMDHPPPSIAALPYRNQVPFFFPCPHVRQTASVCVEISSQKYADAPVDKNGLAVDEKSWCLSTGRQLQSQKPTENVCAFEIAYAGSDDLRCLPPLNMSLVVSVLNQPMPLEHALRFLSWACKQSGFVPCSTDDVNQIAHLWASKYALFTLTDMEGCLDLEGSMYAEATWATLITTSNFLNKPEQSVSIFMQSQKHGCKPSQLLYDPFLFALMKCQQYDAVLVTMQDMLSANIVPGKQVLGSFLDALCKADKSKDAYKLVQDIAKKTSASLRDATYSRLITAVWRTAHSSMALDLLNEMKRKGFEPDKLAYTACVKLLCKKRRFDLAENLLKYASERDCSPDMSTYSLLVDGLQKSRQAKKALEVVEQLSKEGRPIDRVMHMASLSCLFAVGRIDDAFKVFEQMQRVGDLEDPILYHVMIKNLCKIGDAKRALDMKKILNEKGFKADARLYEALQRGLCEGGRSVDDLLSLVEELKSNGHSAAAKTYFTLITHFCCLGDFENARIWAEEMVKEGHKPTPFIKTRFPELQDVLKEE